MWTDYRARPAALYGRDYVFLYKHFKSKILLDGHFINGDTGHVEERTTGKVIEGGLFGWQVK